MTWCFDWIAEADLEMDDVIWSDKSTIQMDPHHKVMYQNKGRHAARPKHHCQSMSEEEFHHKEQH